MCPDYYCLSAGGSTKSARAKQPHLVDHHWGLLCVGDPAGLVEALLEEEDDGRGQAETRTDQDRGWWGQR